MVSRSQPPSSAPTMSERDPFDRILGAIDGLPDVRKTRPSTFTDVVPILGDVSTLIWPLPGSGLLRLSVGLEDLADLEEDFRSALDQLIG